MNKWKKFVFTLLVVALVFGVTATSVFANQDELVEVDGFLYPKDVVDALNYLNEIRAKIGVGQLKLDPYLTEAAKNHANYLEINGSGKSGHDEVPGKQGFTGERPSNRLDAVGAPKEIRKGLFEIIAYNQGSSMEAVDGFLQTAYHRVPLTGDATTYIGIGKVGGTVVMVSSTYGRDTSLDAPRGIYPYDGQTDVPIKFIGSWEKPNPLAQFGIRESGHIISLESMGFPLDYTVTVKDSKGKDVPFFSESAEHFFIYTKEPMKYNETYTVSINYTSRMSDKSTKSFSREWSFTTREDPKAQNNIPPDDYIKEEPSERIPANQPPPTNFNKDNVGVRLNGSFVDLNPQARIINGSTFIPLRGVFEKMDAKVTWHQQTKSITITKDDITIKLTLDDKTAYVNNQPRTLLTAPFTINKLDLRPTPLCQRDAGSQGRVESVPLCGEY